jgi:hypothetical protein
MAYGRNGASKSEGMMSLQVAVVTEPGHGHSNEDIVEVRRLTGDEGILLCALADGQGGQPGGAAAAQLAVQQSLANAEAFAPRDLRQEGAWKTIISRFVFPSRDIPGKGNLWQEQTWSAIISAADEAVARSPEAGFTTLIALGTDGRTLVGASCGDSAAFLLNDGEARMLTEDQYKNPPVGSAGALPIPFSVVLGRHWKLAVVSDGVWKYAGIERLWESMRRYAGQELIAHLRAIVAKGWGGKLPDDFTIAVLQTPRL